MRAFSITFFNIKLFKKINTVYFDLYNAETRDIFINFKIFF